MVDGKRVLLLRLLHAAKPFHVFRKPRDVVFQIPQQRLRPIELALAGLQLRADLAQFALQPQRTTARLLTAADGVSVIANTIGKQEIVVWILRRQALSRRSILSQEATRDARQQFG